MRLTCFVVWKAWASEPLRTTLTLLGIAVGVAVVTAIHVVDHNTVQSQRRIANPDFGRVDLELLPIARDVRPDEVIARLRNFPSIQTAGVLRSVRALAGQVDEQAGSSVLFGNVVVYGLGPLPQPGFEHYRVVAGRDLGALDGENAVLLSERLAQERGLGPGAELVLAAPRARHRGRCVDGQRAPPPGGDGPTAELEPRTVEVVGLVAYENLVRRNQGATLISSYALASALDADTVGDTTFQVDVAYGVDSDRVRRELAEELQVIDENSSLLGETADERAFRNGIKILGGLALVLGMFVVFQTLSHGLVERLRQLGILRALGAGKRAVSAIFLFDALALGVVGAALGVLLGLVLAYAMATLRLTTLGVGKEIVTFDIPATPVLWTVAVGIGFTLAGAAFPLWKARNLPVQRILAARGLDDDAAGGGSVLAGVDRFLFGLLVLVLPLVYLAMTPLLASEGAGETRFVLVQLYALALVFGALLLLAPRVIRLLAAPLLFVLRLFPRHRLGSFLVGRALQRDTGRFAASMCGLTVVLIAWVALQSITAALHADIETFEAAALDQRLFALVERPSSTTELKALEQIDGVESVEMLRGPVSVGFPLYGLDAETIAARGGFDGVGNDLAATFLDERSLVIGRRLAKFRGLSVGDPVRLHTDDGGRVYRVVAISDAAGFFPDERAYAVTAPRWLEQDWCVDADEGLTHFVLHAQPDRHPYLLQKPLRDARPDIVRMKHGQSIADYLRRDTTRDFVVFHVLLAMILALAGVGLVNQMTLAALGRAREIGVLRALTVDRGQLRRLFFVEASTVAMGATLVAVLAGPALGYLVVQGLNRVAGLEAPFAVPWGMLALVPVLAFGLAVLSAWLPGSRALRIEPAAAVRYQ